MKIINLALTAILIVAGVFLAALPHQIHDSLGLKQSHTYHQIGGIVLIIIGGVVFYLGMRKKGSSPPPTPSPPAPPAPPAMQK